MPSGATGKQLVVVLGSFLLLGAGCWHLPVQLASPRSCLGGAEVKEQQRGLTEVSPVPIPGTAPPLGRVAVPAEERRHGLADDGADNSNETLIWRELILGH